MNSLIYFDNAATTFPKPQSVNMATIECMEQYCGNAGRGSHILALKSAQKVFEARDKLSEMFGTQSENVIFTLNTTYALNMAIKGIMSGGGHILISNMEHNSVLRPVLKLAKENSVSYDIFKAYDRKKQPTKKEILSDIISRLRYNTKMLVCLHSSNICSYTLPVKEIGMLCKRHNIIFAVDAAQSAGHIPINMQEDNIDILCMPAHKGLYSPQGCGIMLLSNKIILDTLIEGGNGVNSLDGDMGIDAPERYEGGTLCLPAIAGLCRGLDFIRGIGIDKISLHEKTLWRKASDALSSIRGVTIYDKEHAGSVLLFNIDGITSDTVGAALSERGFCLRSGYHCSALAHKALGTQSGGAVRIGFGIFNSENEIERLASEVEKISLQKT